MKKLFSTLFVVFFATSLMAQTGLTCEDPIPVNKSYTAHVEAGDELWYTAWTYDLPLHVYFSPDSMISEMGPELEIDFTCDYGVYTDRKLDSVIDIVEARYGVPFPVEFYCEAVTIGGKKEWDFLVDERYRDQLTEFGLTYNVQAFVKVYYPESGSIRFTPDQQFQNCMEQGHYVKLGDTIDIAANDSAKMMVLPYSEWKDDSVRIVWTGDKPARVWIAEDECHFTPVDASVYVKKKYDIDNKTPQKLSPSDMQGAIDNWIGAGIFYAKVLSDGPGQLVFERIPLGEIQGGATLLKHGESVKLQANDSRVFCFPKTWKSTEFLANTQYLVGMYVSNTPDFEISDASVVAKYDFNKNGNNRELQLTTGDINQLGAFALDDYLYVRFVCNKSTTLTPKLWYSSTCIENTILISSGMAFPKSNEATYRMIYKDWQNNDFTIFWGERPGLTVYVSSYCDFVTTATDLISKISVPQRKNTTVTADVVNAWANKIDENGYVYIRLNSGKAANVTFTSSKPAEEDPIIPSSPCVASSIELKSGDQLTLNLDSAFTIYRIEYAAWKEQGMSLSWTGTTDLHTFIAETCTFAVAPYNKYVHVYVPVQGEHTLDANAMADLAEYVDEDGYLYIRFLTEKEGVLTVK